MVQPLQFQEIFHYILFNRLGFLLSNFHVQRVNIMLMSFPRSGSSFLGEIFNHNPGVLYLFEPIQTVQKMFSADSLFEFDFSSPSYQNMVFKVFEDIYNFFFYIFYCVFQFYIF